MITEKQILVVEDEVITALDIQRRLKSLGYQVPEIICSGEEAIEKVKQNKPDLILMDINLFGGMDGIEAASKIHSFSDIPIIYLTAFSDNETLQRAKITEPYAYIVKPFKDRDLHLNLEIAFYKYTMEKKLKEKNQWLISVIESIGDAVITTDPEGKIRLMNPIAQALTGWSKDEAIGKPVEDIFNIISEKTDVEIESPVTKVLREDMFYGLADHTALITKEGMKRSVDIIGSTIKIDGNNIIGIVFIFYDITGRIRVDEMMNISDKC